MHWTPTVPEIAIADRRHSKYVRICHDARIEAPPYAVHMMGLKMRCCKALDSSGWLSVVVLATSINENTFCVSLTRGDVYDYIRLVYTAHWTTN